MLIVDLTAICDREVLPLRTGTFNFRTAMSRVIQERGLCVLTVKNRVPTLWRSRRLRLRSDVMGVDTARVPSRFARALAFLAPRLALRADRQKRENVRGTVVNSPSSPKQEKELLTAPVFPFASLNSTVAFTVSADACT